ncbi:NWD1-like protein [Mya arenaria]|uniref:NWD1-like protein n=1 Tax=Mya arenaria TaxID=6604 RepID=A0ABY7DY23_MYAAR|nr:NWD1-like protein [Mya arenaria]
MGSGSSQASKNENKTPSQKQQQPQQQQQQQHERLPGSSVPPKGLPVKQGVISRQKDDQPAPSGHVSTGNGTREASVAVNGGVGGQIESKGQEGESEFSSQVKRRQSRAKSARANRNETKHLVRRMEQGMEDDDDVDNILGLDQMKTRYQLKRQKTMARMENQRKLVARNRFQLTGQKLFGKDKYTGPRTPDEELYLGNMDIECLSTARVVRIFTSSTFTDTQHERNTLMETGYPVVKKFCQGLGYDFQVVDMRWGIRDQATDDHMGTDICIREIRNSQNVSTGPSFVSLMSHKYGYKDFPRTIEAAEFETIMQNVDSDETKKLFKKWYAKDLNADPPVYVAFPISIHLPDFLSTVKDKKDAAKKVWWEESEVIQETLENVAQEVFDAETARKYIRSITETEVHSGLLTVSELGNTCLWIHRTIEDIGDQESNFLLSRFIECSYSNSERKLQKIREMQIPLKEEMKSKLGDNILDYTVKWDKEKGINPNSPEHKKYLAKMKEDFVSKMCALIKTAVDAKTASHDTLTKEITEHIQFCQKKCKQFHGREETLKKIENYVKGLGDEPFVLFGESGTGKTSIMAMAAKCCAKWTNNKCATVLRFIGTTPDSSSIVGLLTSITSQIRKAYGIDTDVSKDLRMLTDEFALSLFSPNNDRPLVILLDSLDQLDTSHNARQLQWLPMKLRPNVKVIVSTLPENQFEAYPILKSTIRADANLVKIPTLTSDDFEKIIDKWLKLKKRNLTPDQKNLLLHMCKKCPSPLFLKLSFDKACMWTSFATKGTTALEPSIRKSIDTLFERLEVMHGKIFVSHALGYLTISRSGLTETELEDILSCDDEVLNDVYMYWTPPIRRLPPMLVIRLRADLEEYLVDRGADNVQVMYWYHRQFIEAARNRYLGDENVTQKLHTSLAAFFAGTWAGVKKDYVSAKGEKGSADRLVSQQPNKFGSSYNLRKLNNLPYHRCYGTQKDLAKKESLCNFDFLMDKLKATNLWSIMEDLALARTVFPDDEAIESVYDALRLSQQGIFNDSNQFIPQMLGRLPQNKNTGEFLRACREHTVATILPDKKILSQPGGQLIHSSDDGSVRLWNVQSGQQIQMYDGLGKISKVRFCCNDTYMIIDTYQKLTIRNAITGEKVFDLKSISDDNPSCLCGENKSVLIVFEGLSTKGFDLMNGLPIHDFQCFESEGDLVFEFPSIAAEIEEEVEYEVNELAFTVDEKHLIYSNVYNNDIVVFDFRTFKKINVVKGDPNDYTRSLHCAYDSKTFYFANFTFVKFLDCKTSKISDELEHPVDVQNVCSNDLKTIVTSAEDWIVRVWDRTKKVQKMSQTTSMDANRIRILCSLKNSRYAVGFGFKTKENDSQFLFIYDDCSIFHMEVLNDEEIIVVHDVVQKLKIINLDSLSVTKEMEGYLPSTRWRFEIVHKRNEVICLSAGRHNVKTYNLQTGKTSCVLQSGQQYKLDGACASAAGNIVAAWSEDGCEVIAFDVNKSKVLHTFRSKRTPFLNEDAVAVSEDGKYVLFKVEGVPKGSKRQEEDSFLEVWDTKMGKLIAELVDAEYHNRYTSTKERSGCSVGVDVFQLMDASTVLSAHDDFILRVTNLGYSLDNRFILATIGKPAEIVMWKFNNFPIDISCKPSDYPEIYTKKDTSGYLELVGDNDQVVLDPADPDLDTEENASDDDDDFI